MTGRDPQASRRPGRPRSGAPLHMVVMRELGGAMRQLRAAAGYEALDAAADALNRVIQRLHPNADRTVPASAVGSRPHLVSARYISDLERGNTSKLEAPKWLLDSGAYGAEQLRGSQLPGWLVRAYDMAFLADGYLVDLHRWAVALHAEQSRTPPRTLLTRRLAEVGLAEYDRAARAFASASVLVSGVVRANRERLARYPAAPAIPGAWLPDQRDACMNISDPAGDIPEGLPVPPGTFLLGRWLLRNAGDSPWSDRIFTRVGRFDAGLITAPLAPVAATAPGHTAEILVPIRAPERPGTYRLCFRLAWPDGVYCYPNTLVGSILTIIVLGEEFVSCHIPWTVR